MSATKKIDGQDLPAAAFAYVGDPANWRTFLLPIHFAGNREKTKNHIRNAISRFAETKGIPGAQESAVWQCIVTAAKSHGIRLDPRQPKRTVMAEPAPIVVTERTEVEDRNDEAMLELAAERFFEKMTAELDDADEAQWRADTKQKLEELTACR